VRTARDRDRELRSEMQSEFLKRRTSVRARNVGQLTLTPTLTVTLTLTPTRTLTLTLSRWARVTSSRWCRCSRPCSLLILTLTLTRPPNPHAAPNPKATPSPHSGNGAEEAVQRRIPPAPSLPSYHPSCRTRSGAGCSKTYHPSHRYLVITPAGRGAAEVAAGEEAAGRRGAQAAGGNQRTAARGGAAWRRPYRRRPARTRTRTRARARTRARVRRCAIADAGSWGR